MGSTTRKRNRSFVDPDLNDGRILSSGDPQVGWGESCPVGQRLGSGDPTHAAGEVRLRGSLSMWGVDPDTAILAHMGKRQWSGKEPAAQT